MANLLSTTVNGALSASGRISATYDTDRYQFNFYRPSASNWWVTNDSGSLGLHLNNVGDRFYFGTGGDFWSSANGWLSTALAGKLSTSGKAADSELIDGIDSSRIVYGDGPRASTGSGNVNDPNQKSGFFFDYQPTGAPFAGEWWNWITVAGNSWTSSNNYSFQLAHQFHGEGFYVRRMTNGEAYSWREVITSGNIGSQSVSYASSAGNADTLDGYHASSLTYVPSWTNNTQNAQRSGFVSGGNWYRVANLGTERFFARVRIYDDSSGGPHSSVEFQVSGAFNNSSNYSFTLTSNGYYSAPSVTQVRILSAGTYDPQYLEVYISYVGYAGSTFAVSLLEARNATVINWDNGSIPSGYSATTWDANAQFATGGRAAIFNSGVYNTNDYSRFGNVLVGQGTYKNTIKPIDDANLNIHTPSGAVYFDTFGQASGSFRAPIFYDSADTGYYLDPNGTSNLLKFSERTMGFNGMNPMSASSPYESRFNASAGYRNGTMGYGNTDFNTIARNWGSGFIDTWSSPANAPGGSTHYLGLQGVHYSDGGSSFYGFQMACAGEADNRFFWRSSWPSMRSWVEMIHSGNIGSQSVSYAASAGVVGTADYAVTAGNADTVGGYAPTIAYSSNNVRGKVLVADPGSGNISTQNPELYSGEVRLGAAWDRGGVYASGVLSLSTSSSQIDFVFNNATKAIIASDGNIYMSWAGSWLSTLLDNKQNASTAITTSNIGSQTVGQVNQTAHNRPAILLNASGTTDAGGSLGMQQVTGEGWTGIFVDYEPYTGWGLWHDNPNNYFSFTAEASTGYIRSFTVPSRESGNRTAYEKFRIDQNNGDVIVGRDGYAQSSFRAPIFYDSQNTGYYLDPNSTSNIVTLYAGALYGSDVYTNGGWFRNHSNNNGIYWSNTGWHLMPENSADFRFHSGNNSDAAIRMETNGTTRGYVYANSSNEIGFLNNGRSWRLRVYSGGAVESYGDFRAPIFYDSADTTYYSDPNGYSNLYGVAIRGDVDSRGGGNQIFFWSGGNTTTSAIGFKQVGGVWSEHGYTSAGYNTYFTMDSANRGWVFRRATVGGSDWTGVNVASISNTGNAQFDGLVNTPAGYVSNGNPWGTANSAYFPNGITTAGGTNWIYGFTYIGNAPTNGAGTHFTTDGHQLTTGSITVPLFLVNNHSDNTKGYRIHNTSGSSVSAMFVNSSNQLVLAAGAVDQVNLNKKVYVNGVALGVNVAPSATAGRIDASNDIVAYSSSDERLKQNITPIENALEKVKSLTGVEFDWKPEYKNAHGYEGHDTGIIAQQVEAVMPSAVRTNDTGFLAVRYEKLIGLLIEANKELAARVEELEKKLG